jgi:transcriptional regulator NrdR family protein
MTCPCCGGVGARVVETRLNVGGDVVRRRRKCRLCGRVFSTRERAVDLADGAETLEREALRLGEPGARDTDLTGYP